MNYGLYLSASGVLTNMYRQDVFANNLANSETVGFKPDLPTIRHREPEAVEDGLGLDVSQDLLEKLGGGVLAGPQHVRFSPGPIQRTGNPLDAALQDDESFFAIRSVDDAGAVSTRYTRDGRFSLNSAGELVNQNGQVVLSDGGDALVVPPGTQARIDAHGQLVTLEGAVLGRVQVARIPDTDKLVKQGGGLFAYLGRNEPQAVENANVRAGHVEGSAVDPIRTLMGMTSAAKAAQSNADMIKFFDRLMESAVTTFGRLG